MGCTPTKERTVEHKKGAFGRSPALNTTPVQKQTKPLADLTVRRLNTINIKLENDTSTPAISGCCFMPGGELVLCDCFNRKIKLLDRSFTLKDSFALQVRPWDVVDLDGSNIAVTMTEAKQIQLFQLLPTVKKGRTISVDMDCLGIAVADRLIYVSGVDDTGRHGKINVYDDNWNVKRILGFDQYGSCLFSTPFYITVSEANGRVFVSDLIAQTVSCLSTDGKIVWRYRNDALIFPRGLYVDCYDNVIVCSLVMKSVHIINSDGKKYKTPTLLSSRDGIVRPQSVTFRAEDQTLVVGCFQKDVIYVCMLN